MAISESSLNCSLLRMNDSRWIFEDILNFWFQPELRSHMKRLNDRLPDLRGIRSF